MQKPIFISVQLIFGFTVLILFVPVYQYNHCTKV